MQLLDNPSGIYSQFPIQGGTISFVSSKRIGIDSYTIDGKEIKKLERRDDWCSEGTFVFLSCNHLLYKTSDGDYKLSKIGIDRWYLFDTSLYYLEKR